MFTTESKLFFGVSAASFLAAFAYLIASNDRMGFVLLFSVGVMGGFLGVVTVGRAVTVGPRGVPLPAPEPPATRMTEPVRRTAWPLVAAAAIVLLVVGLSYDLPMLGLGFVVLGLGAAGWFVEAYKDHRAEVTPGARLAEERVVWPAGLPVLAALAVGVIVVAMSRVLLALPKDAATAFALVASALILALCFFVAVKPRLSSGALTGLVGLLAVVLVGAGVVSAAVGERTIEPEHGTGAVSEVARGTAFLNKSLNVASDRDVIIKFRNDDPALIHNIAVYTDKSAAKLVYFGREINGLGNRTYEFHTGPGTFFFRCEFHPEQMTGTLKVEEVKHASANRS